MTDIEQAFSCIEAKNRPYTDLYRYYDGTAPLKYSTERLARAFGKSFVYFAENWATVIINAVLDRLVLKGFDIGDKTINAKMDDLFSKYNMNLDAQDVHEALQVTGEAFLIVDMVNGETDIYFNDPRMCEMFYDPDRPKLKAYAAKKWVTPDGTYINLYYPDRTEKWVSPKGQTAKSFSLAETVPNEFGIIPVFHFRNSRRLVKGELDASVVSVLDAINKLFSDLMVAAEFDTFKMKVFISQVDPGELKIGPDMKLWLPANENATGQDTSVMELGGSTLDNFLKPINEFANTLAITTRTPKHYFFNEGQAPSGEALQTMESPLVKKVQKKQEAYDPTWKEFMSYVLLLNGITVSPTDISTVWTPVETVQPLTEAQILKTETEAGIPIITSARRAGWAEDEVAQLEQDVQQQNQQKQQNLATSLMNFNRG